MKKLFLSLAAFAALAFPAAAAAHDNSAFVGPRVELNAGVDDVTKLPDTSDINYGAAVGLDLPVGDRFTIGVDGTASNVFENDRILGVGARVGVAVSPSALLFARAGYENYRDAFRRDLDGLAVGGGLELAVNRAMFVKLEGRYTDFDNSNAGRVGGLVGVGLRF